MPVILSPRRVRQCLSCGLLGHAQLRKRVPQLCPGLAVGGGEALVEQARVQASANRRLAAADSKTWAELENPFPELRMAEESA